MKKLVVIFLAVAMLLSCIGCTAPAAPAAEAPAAAKPEAATDSTAAAAEAAPAEAANDKPYAGTVLNVLGNSSNDSTFMQENLAAFEEETGIKVQFEQLSNDQLNSKILVSMAAGGADLDCFMYMAYQNTNQYVDNGWLVDLTQYMDDSFDYEDFMPGIRDTCLKDGVVYAVPHGSEYVILFYNKNMINEAGIDVTKIVTYDDLIAACKTVEEKLPGVHGIALRGQGNGAAAITICPARAYGGNYFDENGKFAIDSDAFCKGIEKYRELYQYAQEGASTMSWSETCNVFAQKQTAFRMDNDAQYSYLIDPASSLLTKDDIGFIALPAGDKGAATANFNWGMAISSGSKNKEAAWEFIKYMNSKESCLKKVLECLAIPSRQSVLNSDELKTFYPEGYTECMIESDKICAGGIMPNMLHQTEARARIGEALDAIFMGADIKTEMSKANVDIQAMLDEEAAD